MTQSAQLTRVVGLQYEPGDGLPQVILKGSGPVADELLRRHYTTGKPQIIRDRELLDKLFRLPVDSYISPELYRVVAVILAHVFAVDRRLKEERNAR